jgi:hypothetical protein
VRSLFGRASRLARVAQNLPRRKLARGDAKVRKEEVVIEHEQAPAHDVEELTLFANAQTIDVCG